MQERTRRPRKLTDDEVRRCLMDDEHAAWDKAIASREEFCRKWGGTGQGLRRPPRLPEGQQAAYEAVAAEIKILRNRATSRLRLGLMGVSIEDDREPAAFERRPYMPREWRRRAE